MSDTKTYVGMRKCCLCNQVEHYPLAVKFEGSTHYVCGTCYHRTGCDICGVGLSGGGDFVLTDEEDRTAEGRLPILCYDCYK